MMVEQGLEKAKKATIWAARVFPDFALFVSEKSDWAIVCEGSISDLEWHSDMTGEELYNLLEKNHLNPYWRKW